MTQISDLTALTYTRCYLVFNCYRDDRHTWSLEETVVLDTDQDNLEAKISQIKNTVLRSPSKRPRFAVFYSSLQ